MSIGILGTKIGMTQVFAKDGNVIPVSVIKAGPCLVLQKKTKQKDGYDAVQLGLVGATPKRYRTKPVQGHLSKGDAGTISFIKEIRGNEMLSHEVGDTITTTLFNQGDTIVVTGWSKGKGFQGVMKRHGFRGLSATHGTHKKQRSPGAIGQCAWPSKVFKGVKMAGRTGNRRTTVKNITVVRVIPEKNLLLVKGPLPGAYRSKVIIKRIEADSTSAE